jgi:hypothetical protein
MRKIFLLAAALIFNAGRLQTLKWKCDGVSGSLIWTGTEAPIAIAGSLDGATWEATN